MKYKINKPLISLILEDYMQDMIDGMDNAKAIQLNGYDAKDYVQDESLLDKTITPDSPPTPKGTYLKSKYNLFDTPDHASLNMIRKSAIDHNIPYEKAVSNAHKYMHAIGHIENDNHVHGTNHRNGSTIKGLYQTSDAQEHTDKARFHRIFKLDHKVPYLNVGSDTHVKDMDAKQQTALTIAGLEGHGNSQNRLQHFSKMLQGDHKAGHDMYYRDHHTNPDAKTYKRAKQIFKDEDT